MIEHNLFNAFYNENTLNIFCDASIEPHRGTFSGCYGAIAMCKDIEIDRAIRICSITSNNNSEIKGIRLGVYMANHYASNFKNINILSDSQISIFGIRDRYITWSLKNHRLYNQSGQEVKSQEIFCEIILAMKENNINVKFWHQKGHVTTSPDSLQNAMHVFASSNMIRDYIDMNLIKYISLYNNAIDQATRNTLYDTEHIQHQYRDAVTFNPEGVMKKVWNESNFQLPNKSYFN